MAKKKTKMKPKRAPIAPEHIPETMAGVSLPDNRRRALKAMVRLSFDEANALRKCAKMKPLATFIRDVMMQYTQACGATG
jgi:hypothetical protein